MSALKQFIPKSSIQSVGGCLALYQINEFGGVEFLFRFEHQKGIYWQLSCINAETLLKHSVPAPENFHHDEIEFIPSRFADQFDYLQQLQKQIDRYQDRQKTKTKKK